MTGANIRSMIRALLALGLMLSAPGGVAPVRAGAACPLDDPLSDFSEFWNAWEPEFLPEWRAQEELVEILFDQPDDTVDRAGTPVDGVDILCAAPFAVTAGGDPVYEALRLAGLPDVEGVVVLAPSDPSDSLLNSPALLFEPIGMATLPSPQGMQLGNGFSGGSFPNYVNPSFIELDGAHTWPGAFFANDQWVLDQTEYRNGAFTQQESSDLIYVIGSDFSIKIKVPPAPEFADSWRSYVVAPNAVDIIDLGTYDPLGLPRFSATEPQATPPPAGGQAATPTQTAAPSRPPAESAPPTTSGAVTTDETPWPLVVLGGLLLAAAVGAFLYFRRRPVAPPSIATVAREHIARDVALTALAGRAWKEDQVGTAFWRSRGLMVAGAIVGLLLLVGVVALASGALSGPTGTAGESEVARATPTQAPRATPQATPAPATPAPTPPPPAAPAALADNGVWSGDAAIFIDPLLDLIYSILGIQPGYTPGYVDIAESGATVVNASQDVVDAAFNASVFDCTQVVDGVLTACASGNAIQPGPLFVAFARMDEPIPQDSTDGLLTYALVLDSDGDPANDFVAQPPFDYDFYQGTDRWYELVYTPQLGWYLTVDRNQTISNARVAIVDDLVAFFVPLDELPVDTPSYRLTAFASSDATFAPETSGGDIAPGSADPDFELEEPDVQGEAAAGFMVRLGRALAIGDQAFVFGRMHPEVLDRYGEATCLAYAAAVIDPTTVIEPGAVSGPEAWDYVTDGLTTSIPDAYSVQASAVLNGQALEAEFHVAIVDGTFRWFTDCGTPGG